MSWTEIILYIIFICVVCAFALLGVMKTDATGNKLHMTDQEVSHVMRNLSKRSAGDCILIRTNYGFSCRDKSDRLFKIYVKGSGNERL